MRVLVGCEQFGRTRDALIALGHDAVSCDIMPSRVPGPHIQGDVLNVLNDGWDAAIFHPDCTYLTSSGLHWNSRIEGRAEKTEEALKFVSSLLSCRIPRIILENPRGCIGTRIRKADQVVQLYQFGDDLSKETHLWLVNTPPWPFVLLQDFRGVWFGMKKEVSLLSDGEIKLIAVKTGLAHPLIEQCSALQLLPA